MLTLRSLDDRDRPTRIPLKHVALLWRRSQRAASRDSIGDGRAGGPKRWGVIGRAIRTAASPKVLIVLLPALGGTIILTLIVVLMTQDRAMAIGLLVFSPVYVPLLTLLMITGRGLFGLGRSLAENVSSSMLEDLRCPACAYDVSRSPVETDGCRCCSECGSAWSDARCGERGREPAQIVVVRGFKTPNESGGSGER